MPNEPLVSVGSNNRIGNRNTIVVAIIPTLAITTVGIIAIWPYLHAIGAALEYFSFVLLGALTCVLVIAIVYLARRSRLHLAHLDRQSRLLTWSEGAAWHSVDGEMVHLSAEHEQAKLPAPRVEVSEVNVPVDPDDPDLIERSKVLNMREDGATLEEIRDALGIPYNRVQRYCKAAVNLVIKKKR